MSDLVAWLEAVHTADEQTARKATEATGMQPWEVTSRHRVDTASCDVAESGAGVSTLTHIARHDPQLVLARIEAERMLASLHEPRRVQGLTICLICNDGSEPEYDQNDWSEWPCPTLRALAWGYRHRDGYRAEWAPDGVETTP